MPQENFWPESHEEQTDVLPAVREDTTVITPVPGGGGSGSARDRRKRLAIIAGTVFGVLAMLYLVDMVVSKGAVPRGVTVAGVQVGGMSYQDAEQKLRERLEPRMSNPVQLRAGDVRTELRPSAAGLTLNWQETLDRAGSQPWNPITRVTSFFSTHEVGVVTDADPAKVGSAVEGLREQTDRKPREGTIEFEGTEDGTSAEPVVVPPKKGQKLEGDAAQRELVEHWVSGKRVNLPVRTEPVQTTEKGVRKTLNEVVAPAVSGPVMMHGDGKDVELQPAVIAAAMSFKPAEDGDGLDVKVDRKHVAEALGPELASTEQQGRDAEIVFEGGKPDVRPSKHGRVIDWKKSLEPLRKVLGQQDSREIKLVYKDEPAKVTTEEAKKLGIKEVVGEFSTGGFASDSGVNIKRVAEQVDGAIVKPGETFSLNGHTGKRGRAQGYVEAGIIEDGAPSTAVGGGISQFATTLYNAAYFAAMEDVEHKEHSYYISRYPEAREATVFQSPNGASVIDLKFKNTAPTGVAIQTSWTPSSITVKLWGTKHYEVESRTGDRHDFAEPPTKQGPDEECQPSSGARGFTSSDTRIIRKAGSGEVVDRQTRNVRYNPQPKIVCE